MSSVLKMVFAGRRAEIPNDIAKNHRTFAVSFFCKPFQSIGNHFSNMSHLRSCVKNGSPCPCHPEFEDVFLFSSESEGFAVCILFSSRYFDKEPPGQ